jgi:hypothetical protein
MTSYRDPSFRDRAGSAAAAKQKALDQLRARPKADPALVAERQAARAAREEAERERRAAKAAAKEQDRIDTAGAAPVADAEHAGPGESEAERKAARDARYAARKSRR